MHFKSGRQRLNNISLKPCQPFSFLFVSVKIKERKSNMVMKNVMNRFFSVLTKFELVNDKRMIIEF